MQRSNPKTATRSKKTKRAQTKLTAIFNALSDDRSLELFKLIADVSGTEKASSERLKTRLKLTRKQFYSRLEVLMKIRLIKRKKGTYFLTSLGKLINGIQLKVQKAVDIELKLKAIDSLVMSGEDIPKEEHAKLIEELVGKSDREFADILLKDT